MGAGVYGFGVGGFNGFRDYDLGVSGDLGILGSMAAGLRMFLMQVDCDEHFKHETLVFEPAARNTPRKTKFGRLLTLDCV